MSQIFTALLDLPEILEGAGFNVIVAKDWEEGQCDPRKNPEHYLWTNPDTNGKSHDGIPRGYLVHHTATSTATPPPHDTSKANAWIGLLRDGKLYQTGGGIPTIYLASAGPTRTGAGYGYKPAAWDYTFKEKRSPASAGGSDSNPQIALNRYSFGAETVHKGDGSAIDPGVLGCVIGLGIALEQITGLKEMTLGHRSWTRRKIDPYWNNDHDCIIPIQQAVADDEQGGSMADYIEGGPFTIPRRTWVTLLVLPAPHGDKNTWASYIRVNDSDATQFITRFVRDPNGVADHTGSEDRSVTLGKDYISRVWPFRSIAGTDTGIQFWHDASDDIVVEYAQLKRV